MADNSGDVENIFTPEELELLNEWPTLNGGSEAFWESVVVNEPCSQEAVIYKEILSSSV